jgi:4-aminobutyrate aminotransferase
MLDLLQSWVGEVPGVGDARGFGMNCGVELVKDRGSRIPAGDHAARAHALAAEMGVLVLPPTGNGDAVLRVVPPLVIEEDLLWEGLERLRSAIERTAEPASPT